MARQPPPQQPPPVMRLLVLYGKQDKMRFASHRDFARVFERALRRAEIPMAYSSGFTPHPRISYINPTFTGAESRAEYLVIALSAEVEPEDIRQRLDSAMPEGFPILGAGVVLKAPTFESSLWEVTVADTPPADLEEACEVVQMGTTALEVVRETKNGPRRFDVRPSLESLTLTDEGALRMVIHHTEPLVRPDDVLGGLRTHHPHLGPTDRIIRLSQTEGA